MATGPITGTISGTAQKAITFSDEVIVSFFRSLKTLPFTFASKQDAARFTFGTVKEAIKLIPAD
ncbi:MAG: hypothetical protein JW841_07810 [Deltaproteobacteria bacterium]|nr:hypothetical protein [Deltaproteobacteria bacterium]